jgi:hypothetical protein
MVLAAAAVALLMIGVRPAPEPRDPDPFATYPIAADAEAERTQASANFSVTWIHDAASPDAPSLRDRDGTGVPDTVEELLSAFEAARTFLLGDLGYRPPPTGGPFRVYVAARDGEAITKIAPGGSEGSSPSFVVIATAMLKPPLTPRQLRIVALHEYFHAVQNGYDAGHDHWIGEATAAWVEDVFDDAADANHRHLIEFVPYPQRSLTDLTARHEYGAFLFIQYLVERFGGGHPGLVRELWEEMAVPEAGGRGRDSLGAIEAVLAKRGATFDRAWAEFQLWRWDLDRFEEGESYLQALKGQWPRASRTTEVRTESCRLSAANGSALPPVSGDYQIFRPADRPDSARATVTVEGPVGAVGFTLTKGESGEERVQFLEVGNDGLASARVRFGDEEVRRITLGVANPAGEGDAGIDHSLRILGRNGVSVQPVGPPAETALFGGLTLQGRVVCNGQPAESADVLLLQDTRTGEDRTFELTTFAGGTWARTFEPGQTSTYTAQVVDPLLSPATSASWDVAVRVAVTLEVADQDVALGEPVPVEGSIAPPHPGATVLIEYRRPDLSWRAGPQTVADAEGRFATSVALPDRGIWHLRATVLSTADADHVPSGTINDLFVNVR